MLGAAIAVASVTAAPSQASAQCMAGTPNCSQVTPTAKGMIGLGLIGAELGLIIPALIQEATGTNEWWPYLVFPLVGAAGGIIGGYFMEEATVSSPEVDVIFMAIGMALVVPAVVGTLALTAYDPGDTATRMEEEDLPPLDDSEEEAYDSGSSGGDAAPASETAPASEGASLRTRVQQLLAGGPGILRFDGPRILVAVPVVGRMSTYTESEHEALPGLARSTDVFIPVISGAF